MCGSQNVATVPKEQDFPLAFGESVQLTLAENQCGQCGEEGDFLAANDPVIEAGIAAAESALACRNIATLAAQGWTMASCERALGLAPRTMARWKSGRLSDAAAALLKVLRTYPWILNVARTRFDRTAAERELAKRATYARVVITRSSNSTETAIASQAAPIACEAEQGYAGELTIR
jgi:hypothetical protein